MADQEDFEDFEESEEQPVKPTKKRSNRSKNNSQAVAEETPAQTTTPQVSASEYLKYKEKLLGADEKETVESDSLNIEMIGPDIYRLSTLYYASSNTYYSNMQKFVDFYDGTFHIKEFEKNCSLPQQRASVLTSFCEQNEKDKLKRLNKDKKNEMVEETAKEESKEPEFDPRRDLNGEHPYQPFKEALEESNPLNGYEFYDDLYRDFCNNLNQNTPETDIKERLELPERKKIAEKKIAQNSTQGQRSNRKMSNHMLTPNMDSYRSPGHSPKSSIMDSFHSFNDMFAKRQLIFSGREDNQSMNSMNASTKGNSTKHGDDHLGANQTEQDASLASEKEILAEFQKMLQSKEKAGKLKFIANTTLNKRTSTSGNPIFQYSSITNQEEISGNSFINKRSEKEVFLDYESMSLPIKRIKSKLGSSGHSCYYSNADLVYSSWYDATMKMINGEEDQELKKNLLIDLNDRSVFYSKLMSLLNEKNEPEKALAEMPELGIGSMPNNRLIEKMFNKAKKEMRIKIAKGRGGTEFEDRTKDDLMNEEDFKLINILNQPNPNSSSVGGILGVKNIQNSKYNTKKNDNTVNYRHSEVANTFQFNIWRMSKDKIKNLHRYDMSKVIMTEIMANRNGKWKVKIQNNSLTNYPLKKQLSRKRKGISDINSQEIHHSQAIFKKFSKLSLKTDEFILFEYVEKNPLLLGNIGMASRLTKYYYTTKILRKIVDEHGPGDEKEITFRFWQFIRDKFGEHGEVSPLKENEQLPTLGQLVGNKCEGLTILENNLYQVPVFKQKTRKNDFILVRVFEKGEYKYYLRKIRSVYTAGQIQPKSEVYCPYSRLFRTFLKKLLKFSINRLFEEKRSVHLKELKEIFPTVNDHNLRKNIKMLGGEQDTMDNKFYIFNEQLLQDNKSNDYNNETEASITPEELCLYERMYQTYYDLLDFGITKLKSSDKISVIKTKFYRNNLDNPEKCAIARRIIQELLLTSWNLSQSFVSAVQTQGRMYLNGYGDPTNGHGGMNFIKLPLKISRYESQLFRKSKKGKTNQMVTGTNADLRRLPMVFVHETLRRYGYTEDTLAALERWDKIELLREISNKQQGDNKAEDLDKFKREIRMTTKMQKEKYQADINELLMTMVQNLSCQDWDEIPSDDEMDTQEDMGALVQAEENEIAKYRNLNSDEEEESGEDDSNEDEGEDEGSKQLNLDFEGKIEFD